MRIQITQDNINNAIKKNSHRCMIADAIQKEIDWAKYIMVDLQSIRFSDINNNIRYFYLTPPKAQKELLNFDQGKKVKPFILNLTKAIERPMRKMRTLNPKRKRTYKYSERTRYMPSPYREFGLRKLSR